MLFSLFSYMAKGGLHLGKPTQIWISPNQRYYPIVAIDAIVDQGNQYGCLKMRLDLRIATSEADFV